MAISRMVWPLAGAAAAAVGAPLAVGAMASLIAVLALVARRAVPSLADLK